MNERETINNHANEMQGYWDRQTPILAKLYGGVEAYIQREVSDIREAFQLKDRCARCIDERTVGGIHLAGCGILLGKERAVEILRAAGVDSVSSHSGCGAATLAYDNLPPEGKATYPDAQSYAIAWTKELAEQLGVPYKHFEVEPEFHFARVIYYDGTGTFDPSAVSTLPRGFMVSRKYLDTKDALYDLNLAVEIALGPHGVGDRVQGEGTQLLIIPIGTADDPKLSLDALMREIGEMKEEYKGKIKVDGFTASS